MQQIIYKKFDSIRPFGVELEVCNKVSKSKIKTLIDSVSHIKAEVKKFVPSINNFDKWHVKDDASCGPKGFDGPKGIEIASYVGRGIEDIKHISCVADFLQTRNVVVNDNCGFHIHVNMEDFSTEQMGKFLAYWLKIEHLLGMTVAARRRANEFCKYLYQRSPLHRGWQYTAYQIWDVFKPDDMKPFDNDDRRVNLNIVNYARTIWKPHGAQHRKTVELRWPEGTLDGKEIKNWLRLFLHFIESCKNREMPKNLETSSLLESLEILGLHHEKEEFYIFSEGLLETKTWLLEKIIYNLSTMSLAYWYEAFRKHYTFQAKEILNQIWSPLKIY